MGLQISKVYVGILLGSRGDGTGGTRAQEKKKGDIFTKKTTFFTTPKPCRGSEIRKNRKKKGK